MLLYVNDAEWIHCRSIVARRLRWILAIFLHSSLRCRYCTIIHKWIIPQILKLHFNLIIIKWWNIRLNTSFSWKLLRNSWHNKILSMINQWISDKNVIDSLFLILPFASQLHLFVQYNFPIIFMNGILMHSKSYTPNVQNTLQLLALTEKSNENCFAMRNWCVIKTWVICQSSVIIHSHPLSKGVFTILIENSI